ncbi:MAG: hypothetical protein ABI836_06475 [Gemmatimonadota bacterium]
MAPSRGTTLVELIVALTMLTIGVLGLIGTTVIVNAYLTRGRWGSFTAAESSRRLEILRETASSQGCAGLSGGMAAYPASVTQRWSVSLSSLSADLVVVMSSPRARPETLATTILCP